MRPGSTSARRSSRNVAAFYVTPARLIWSQPHFLAALVAAAGLTVTLVLVRSRWPGPLATWAAFLVFLAPVAGFVSTGKQFVTDRYTYLAAMAFVPLVAGESELARVLAIAPATNDCRRHRRVRLGGGLDPPDARTLPDLARLAITVGPRAGPRHGEA